MRRMGIDYEPAEQHPCNLSKAKIDEYASNVAAALKFDPGGDVQALVRRLGGRIHIEDPFGPGPDEDSIFVHSKNDFDIILSAISSSRRDRFTIAHELGHYLLHSRLGERPLRANRSGSNRAEWEANWFAAGFLMPRDRFAKCHQDGYSIGRLADEFAVSESAARVRLEALGLS
jgi:predicted transcriptional regulator